MRPWRMGITGRAPAPEVTSDAILPDQLCIVLVFSQQQDRVQT